MCDLGVKDEPQDQCCSHHGGSFEIRQTSPVQVFNVIDLRVQWWYIRRVIICIHIIFGVIIFIVLISRNASPISIWGGASGANPGW